MMRKRARNRSTFRHPFLWSGLAVLGAAGVAAGLFMTSVRADAAPVPPTRLGINLTPPAYWIETRSFTNLAIYGDMSTLMADGRRGKIDASMIGPAGWPANVAAGMKVVLPLLMPQGAKVGTVIHCSWQGQAEVGVEGTGVAIGGDAHNLLFKLKLDAQDTARGITGQTARVRLLMGNISPAAPITAVDCRERDRPATQIFDPAFVQSLEPYRVVRFMDWMNVNSGLSADFTRETMPERPRGADSGVTLPDMIALAIEAKVDPWFTIPWGADDDYVRRFAQMAHDRLPADRTVYVELANEVWNAAFPAAQRARAEGLAAGLSTNPTEAQLRQYALKSKQMLDIWTRIYADRPTSLVRVVSSQHVNSWASKTILGYKDVAKSVDALATAPYFGNNIYAPGKDSPRPPIDEAFVQLEPSLDRTLDFARQQQAVARQYGKRYIAYEAGQHIVIHHDVPLLSQISHDPRMGKAYTRFLDTWAAEIGDTLALFNKVGTPGPFGAWGLEDFDGQALADAPKKQAVLQFADKQKASGRQ